MSHKEQFQTIIQQRQWENGSRDRLQQHCRQIQSLSQEKILRHQKLWDQLCKPLHCFGNLEKLMAQIAAIEQQDIPEIDPVAAFTFVADNGIACEGVSEKGQELTTQIMLNMAQKQASVAILSDYLGVDHYPINLGAAYYQAKPNDGIISYPICPQGTRNFLQEPAMTEAEMLKALFYGNQMAKCAAQAGYRFLIGGEMGTSNTTTSTALACILLDLDTYAVTGRGAGVNDRGFRRKREVIQEAKSRYQSLAQDPLSVLAAVGGLDIAALTGFYLGAAEVRVPVIMDGIISYAAALTASRLAPRASQYFIASHLPHEPCSQAIMHELSLTALLDLDMSLGEGAACLFLIPILRMALEELTRMPSFADVHISQYRNLRDET